MWRYWPPGCRAGYPPINTADRIQRLVDNCPQSCVDVTPDCDYLKSSSQEETPSDSTGQQLDSGVFNWTARGKGYGSPFGKSDGGVDFVPNEGAVEIIDGDSSIQPLGGDSILGGDSTSDSGATSSNASDGTPSTSSSSSLASPSYTVPSAANTATQSTNTAGSQTASHSSPPSSVVEFVISGLAGALLALLLAIACYALHCRWRDRMAAIEASKTKVTGTSPSADIALANMTADEAEDSSECVEVFEVESRALGNL